MRICTLLSLVLAGASAFAELEPEPLGRVATVPAPHPANWLFVHDGAMNHMREGKFLLVDPSVDGVGGQLRGILPGDFMAAFLTSHSRGEHYVIESFFARGGRGGERTDVVTIYDPATLAVAGEVVIPAKRLTGLPNRYAATLLGGDRFLVVYNFTPAQSVSVVDLERRAFVGEIEIPGCAFVYPAGPRSFASLCSDGGMVVTRLDEAGASAGTHRLAAFNDIAGDALFEKPAYIGRVAYFPTFTGNVVPIAMGDQPSVGEPWSLTTADERAAGWRPGGVWPVAGAQRGLLYVLMHGHGAEGTHKDGGDQVWVFHAASGERRQVIELERWGIALGLTAGEPQRLAVTCAEPVVDIYDAADGAHVRTLEVSASSPLLVHAVR